MQQFLALSKIIIQEAIQGVMVENEHIDHMEAVAVHNPAELQCVDLRTVAVHIGRTGLHVGCRAVVRRIVADAAAGTEIAEELEGYKAGLHIQTAGEDSAIGSMCRQKGEDKAIVELVDRVKVVLELSRMRDSVSRH
jgi:hypothetical protein